LEIIFQIKPYTEFCIYFKILCSWKEWYFLHTGILNKYGETITIKEFEFELTVFVSVPNKRIRVIDYRGPNLDKLVDSLNNLAKKFDWVNKIFAKVRECDSKAFTSHGYKEEGIIRSYFNGKNAVVVSKYLDPLREYTDPVIHQKENKILEELEKTDGLQSSTTPALPDGYHFLIPRERIHFKELAGLYKEIYESYPFPIFEPDYLEGTAKSNIVYGLIYNTTNILVAAASAEIDIEHANAEMTDFATRPTERGKGLASILLRKLENEVLKKEITSFYTIARSQSLGMNRVFKRAGYEYTGKLINNCHICGNFENMSIWCKELIV
jgi:putative beta-lysine N-acetyltransferase